MRSTLKEVAVLLVALRSIGGATDPFARSFRLRRQEQRTSASLRLVNASGSPEESRTS